MAGLSAPSPFLVPCRIPCLSRAHSPPLPTAHHLGQRRTPGPRADHAQLQLREAAVDHQPRAQSVVRVSQQQARHCRGRCVLQPVRVTHVARRAGMGALSSGQAWLAVLPCG